MLLESLKNDNTKKRRFPPAFFAVLISVQTLIKFTVFIIFFTFLRLICKSSQKFTVFVDRKEFW